MSIVARMQLVMAVIERFGFESVGSVDVTEEKAVILIHENAEFFKVVSEFKEQQIEGYGALLTRMEAEVDGVLLVAYKHQYEIGTAS